MEKTNNEIYAHTDEKGRLILPPEVAAYYGIKPNSRLIIEKIPEALKIMRPVTQLNKLYIEVTSQCNLNCRTCVRHSWNEPMGNMEEPVFSRVLEGLTAFSPMPSVFFGGFGEPLLHPNIIEMIKRLRAQKIPVELITNGTLLTEEMSEKLIQSGLNVLWVSIDGASPESYTDVRLGAALPGVLRNIEKLNGMRFSNVRGTALRLGIAFVAMKRNIKDLPEVVRMASRMYANYLMVTNVLPYTPEMLEDVLYYLSLSHTHYQLPDLKFPVELRKPVTNEMFPGEYAQPILSINLPRMDMNDITKGPYSAVITSGHSVTLGGTNFQNANNRCPFITNGTGAINWEGNLSPCLPLMHSYDMYLDSFHRHSKRWIIGSIKEKSLVELWNTPEHQSFRERVQAFEFTPCTLCGGCEYLETNEQDCYGNGFPTCGGCLWAQGFVQCP